MRPSFHAEAVVPEKVKIKKAWILSEFGIALKLDCVIIHAIQDTNQC